MRVLGLLGSALAVARACPRPSPLRHSYPSATTRRVQSWAVPAVAVAACNGGSPDGPGTATPFVFLGVVVGTVVAATGTVECAGGDGAAAGSGADGSTPWNTPSAWITNPLQETLRVPFSAAAGRQCHAVISTSELRYVSLLSPPSRHPGLRSLTSRFSRPFAPPQAIRGRLPRALQVPPQAGEGLRPDHPVVPRVLG
jgi:hypothetical protein